jgi:hypothetical protein
MWQQGCRTVVITDQKPANPSGNSHKRRLSDKILIAFHHACDQADIEIAAELLGVLEFVLRRLANLAGGRDRRARETLVAAHERLWQLRHPELQDC